MEPIPETRICRCVPPRRVTRARGPQRTGTDGAPMRERGSMVSHHAGNRRRARRRCRPRRRRLEFHPMLCARPAEKRLEALRQKNKRSWFEEGTKFFDVRAPSRALGTDAGGLPTLPIIAASKWPCCASWDGPCTANYGPTGGYRRA